MLKRHFARSPQKSKQLLQQKTQTSAVPGRTVLHLHPEKPEKPSKKPGPLSASSGARWGGSWGQQGSKGSAGAPACGWTLSLTLLAPESSTWCTHVYRSHETVRPSSLNEQLVFPVTAFHLFCFLPQAPNPVQEDPPGKSWVTVQVWGDPLPGWQSGGEGDPGKKRGAEARSCSCVRL